MTFTYRKILASVTLVLLLLLVLFVASSSAESLSGNQVVIEADQVVEDDLYVAAGELIIDGTVKGDVLAFAGSVTVNGTIEGDLIAGAQVIVINGLVADDARLGAQAVVLGTHGEIGDDAMVGSFSLEAKQGSSIGGDLWLGLYQALLAGEVSGDVLGGGAGIQIDGQVNGNVDIEVGDPSEAPPFSISMFMPQLPAGVTIPNVQPGLTVDEGAAIGGTLSYTSQSAANIAGGTVSGPVTHQEPVIEEEEAPPPGAAFASWLLRQVRRLLRLLAVGLLMVWLLPAWLARSSQALRANPWPSLGWGALSPFALLVVLVATLIMILAIALLIRFVIGPATLVTMLLGSVAGTLTLAYLLLTFYVAALVAGYTLSQMALSRINANLAARRLWVMIVGVLIVWAVTFIPVAGTLIGLVLALFGLGAIWMAIRSQWSQATPDAEPLPAA